MHIRSLKFLLPLALVTSVPACSSESDEAVESTDDDDSEAGEDDDDSEAGEDDDDSEAGEDDDDAPTEGGAELEVPDGHYDFASRYDAAESSVVFTGQTWRHTAIAELTSVVAGMTDTVNANALDEEEARALLDIFFRNADSTLGGVELSLTGTAPILQGTFGDIATGNNLVDKVAGNDAVTDHRVWNGTPAEGDTEAVAPAFAGWSAAIGGETAPFTPTALIDGLFGEVAANAAALSNGMVRMAPDGETELPVHVMDNGVDLQQMIQKFLLGAIAFSQGTDDYLDSGTEGKGLEAANERAEDSTSFHTPLEHAWDEAFGYFGATRNFLEFSDAEIAKNGSDRADWQGSYDTDGDGLIDLSREFIFGHASNAAKRDLGAQEGEETDFTQDAFDAILEGRQIIAGAGATLSDEERTALQDARDRWVVAWEQAIAATVVHYINDTLGDMDNIGTEEYSFADHAKHWSELKGFALGLQFNPRSPMHESSDDDTDSHFVTFHDLIGDAPVLESATAAELEAYEASLLEARELLGTAYGFAAANLENW